MFDFMNQDTTTSFDIDLERWKNLQELVQQSQKFPSTGHPCPQCGYCPHCGRGGYGFRTWPYQQPYWYWAGSYQQPDFETLWKVK